MHVSFNTLRDNCVHQGMIRNDKKWCGYHAQCWSDWHLCTKGQCPLLKGEEKLPGDEPVPDGQIEISEYMTTLEA